MLVIGSKAAYSEGLAVTPQDLDLIGTFEEYQTLIKLAKNYIIATYPLSENKFFIKVKPGCDHTIGMEVVEFEVAWDGSSAAMLLDICEEDRRVHKISNLSRGTLDFWQQEFRVALLPTLYALKMSHRYLRNNPHFKKTMDHIHQMRELLGSSDIDPKLVEWLAFREKETYNYAHPNLKQSKGDFFADDKVPYKYDHDTIHLAVKMFDKPAYEYFKADGAQVQCSQEKFNALSDELKIAAVLEESYVLALERCLIPEDFRPNPHKAFTIALEKVCTSITSGWFREYAWENYNRVMEKFDIAYVLDFKHGLESGIVKEVTDGNTTRIY